MFEEQRVVKVFRVTVKKVIQRLLEINECPFEEFEECVIEQFDGYDYEGEENLVGFTSWDNLDTDGKYQLSVKIDHFDAYEFTLFVEVKKKKVSIYNVL